MSQQIENPRDRADKRLAEVINQTSRTDPDRMRIAALIGQARDAIRELDDGHDALVHLRAARSFGDLSQRSERLGLREHVEQARDQLEESTE